MSLDPEQSTPDLDPLVEAINRYVRETAQALVVVALVMVLAVAFGAPLGERANPGMSPNPAKAPWYFMGFQELLIHLHPTFAVLVIRFGHLRYPYGRTDDEKHV